jgi:hypothetical protein
MLNKDKTPREYAHIDPDNLPVSNKPPYKGTRAECLADAILDVIQAGLAAGLEQKDVDEAMRTVTDTLAMQERHRFRLHVKDKPKGKSKAKDEPQV